MLGERNTKQLPPVGALQVVLRGPGIRDLPTKSLKVTAHFIAPGFLSVSWRKRLCTTCLEIWTNEIKIRFVRLLCYSINLRLKTGEEYQEEEISCVI